VGSRGWAGEPALENSATGYEGLFHDNSILLWVGQESPPWKTQQQARRACSTIVQFYCGE